MITFLSSVDIVKVRGSSKMLKRKDLGEKVGQLHKGLGNATGEWQDQNLSNESPRPTVRFFLLSPPEFKPVTKRPDYT